MSQAPRRINTDRSLHRPDQAAKAAPRPAAGTTAGTTGTSGRPAAGSTSGSGRSAPPRHSVQPARQAEPPRRRKKKKKTPLWLPFAVVMAVIAVVSGVVVYGVSMLNKVEDSLRPDDSTPTIQEEVKTAEEYKGDVVNILVCGIDYEEGRNYSDASSNDGMTDMILYCQFDIKNGALHMLQIPRNSLVATQNRKITLSNLRRLQLPDQLGGSVQRRQHRRAGRCDLRPVPPARGLLRQRGHAGTGGNGGQLRGHRGVYPPRYGLRRQQADQGLPQSGRRLG